MDAMLSAISKRATAKVLAPEPWEATLSEAEQADLIQTLLTAASYAPYHYTTSERYKDESTGLISELPYRCYTLDARNARGLADWLQQEDVAAGKVINMLWAAEAVIAISWLPDVFGKQPKDDERAFEPVPFVGNLRNMEHVAAASAAAQNVLLTATELGYLNYWSSGGMLRQKVVRDKIGIPMREVMLGFLFVFPADSEKRGAEVKPGKNREKGKALKTWSKAVRL